MRQGSVSNRKLALYRQLIWLVRDEAVTRVLEELIEHAEHTPQHVEQSTQLSSRGAGQVFWRNEVGLTPSTAESGTNRRGFARRHRPLVVANSPERTGVA